MTNLIRWGECLFLIPLSLGVILRVAPELAQHPHFALFLVSELVGVALLLLQRRGETTTRLSGMRNRHSPQRIRFVIGSASAGTVKRGG